jgi:flagellar motility protein MotE (MotC chaperone)
MRVLLTVIGAVAQHLLGVVLATPATAEQGWEPVVAAVAEPAPPGRPAVISVPLPIPATRPKPPAHAREPISAPVRVVAQKEKPAASPAPARGLKPEETPSLETSAARQYCVNIADAAAEARFAWQKQKLSEMEQELEKRIALLEEKTADYKRWLTRRDEFVNKARESLVLIYTRMRPDAAAMQLMAMDEETAAAVLIKLDPRVASTILNDMEPGHAARLTSTISSAVKAAPGAKPQSGGGDGKS